ncbi:hypothetical protein NOS3756_23600 [Nostoc sp. NIES-3756]|uniref:hypothetical protein n=1 Tax=Nostoc sp. NIES-3756 TaxID=1751286 RepID=UPI00071F7FD6|nr:hypothetical protein [Nostoc sp. NIES-3756]BAT53400.1 hypothetical protein NOS3756_23600 [Nostoc sp. NIES-3756]
MWEPISEDKLFGLIDSAEVDMEAEPSVKIFWERIKIKPQKWQLSPWGDEGGGFWVVALIGTECIYYNDIEEGFNISRFDTIGLINDYLCNQSNLTSCIHFYYQSFMQALGCYSVSDSEN